MTSSSLWTNLRRVHPDRCQTKSRLRGESGPAEAGTPTSPHTGDLRSGPRRGRETRAQPVRPWAGVGRPAPNLRSLPPHLLDYLVRRVDDDRLDIVGEGSGPGAAVEGFTGLVAALLE